MGKKRDYGGSEDSPDACFGGLGSPRTLDNAEMLRQFVGACRGECGNPLDVHAACDLTLPGLVSEQSVEEDGRWVAVPDSREWTRQARM